MRTAHLFHFISWILSDECDICFLCCTFVNVSVCVCVLSDRFLFVLSVSLMLTESFYNKRKSSKFHLMSNNGRFSTRNHRHTEQKQKNTKKRAYSNTDVFKHSETFQDKVFAIIPRTKTETRRLSTNSHLYAIQFHSLFSFFWAVF